MHTVLYHLTLETVCYFMIRDTFETFMMNTHYESVQTGYPVSHDSQGLLEVAVAVAVVVVVLGGQLHFYIKKITTSHKRI